MTFPLLKDFLVYHAFKSRGEKKEERLGKKEDFVTEGYCGKKTDIAFLLQSMHFPQDSNKR